MADRGESARSRSEFTNSKPLPPIGSKDDDGDRSESQATDRSRSVADDDTNSNGNAFDRPGEGAARPRIVRAFRPEMISDEEMENEKRSLRTFKKKTYDGPSTPDGKDGASQSPKPSSSKLDIADEKATPDIAAYQMPYSDEYGIPILDLSSDTDDYQRESEKHDIPVEDPEERLLPDDVDTDDMGIPHGMFSGKCEFCKSLYCCNDYREFVEFVTSTNRDMEDEQSKKTKLIDIKPHEHVGMREREIQRRQQEAIARQMKTINYQLSSQKCLDEGWTVRAPSPLFDDLGDDVFTPEPLNPDMIADGKPIENAPAFRPDSEFYRQRLRERPLIEKFYESGQKFLTMFPDGTGNYGGLELDHEGAKKRKWSWKDQVTHVHAPPFQPICIGLNREMGLVAPENAPLKEVDEGHIFLEEKKAHVESILSKVENLLKFPNNPKLDKMLPPLHVTSRQVKTERLKQDRALYLAQQSERDKKQNSIPAN
ncbi:hypothetical protein MAR_014267 [Mya arenaria]|uniref:FAM194 C-terminal domain-containing protein n=1 Tax=Mya arenaria TaxID=6604 RepID=A0ABY7G280_MYAAR|nr:hypothetical protein MAR_014267 [Mya arenaria]